ncbi:MAG: TetR/AcrR family transcriptional regulator [Vallitaleaceae bacterium]|jgi:AcrR family transcriptional regulator|nr:TetR/AcrR family transcriptional regulator [Vallitaleaceae bacterium]
MKTQKAINTHNAIVDAAAILFMKKSVSSVTISEIVKQAGVAKGTFYLYFESKDDLVWHFIDHELGDAFTWFNEIINKGYEQQDIDEIIDFIMGFVKSHITGLKLLHHVRFYSFLGKKNIEDKFIKEWIEPIHLWLEKGKRLEKLDIVDTKFYAIFITTAIHNMLDQIIVGELTYDIDEFGIQVKLLLGKLLK